MIMQIRMDVEGLKGSLITDLLLHQTPDRDWPEILLGIDFQLKKLIVDFSLGKGEGIAEGDPTTT